MSPTLEEVATTFNHWRTTRSKRGKIPEDLIKQAVGLIGQHSKAEIARHLRINHSMLNRWLESKPDADDFMVLPITTQPASMGMAMELSLPDGTRLTMSASAEQAAIFVSALQQRGQE